MGKFMGLREVKRERKNLYLEDERGFVGGDGRNGEEN